MHVQWHVREVMCAPAHGLGISYKRSRTPLLATSLLSYCSMQFNYIHPAIVFLLDCGVVRDITIAPLPFPVGLPHAARLRIGYRGFYLIDYGVLTNLTFAFPLLTKRYTRMPASSPDSRDLGLVST